MARPDLIVAIGAQHEQLGVADPTADVADEVKGCLICPVDVLDHDDRRTRRSPKRSRIWPNSSILASSPTSMKSRNGRNGAGVGQRVACANNGLGAKWGDELRDKARLPRASLSPDQDERAAPDLGPTQSLVQGGELAVALEKHLLES